MPSLLSPELQAKLPQYWDECSRDDRWHQAAELQGSLVHCREVTRHHAKSFYFSSFPLPPAKRHAAYVVYTFCRYVDDVIDEAEQRDAMPSKEVLSARFDAIINGDDGERFAPALRKVVEVYGIPHVFFHDLIHGCCLDREPLKLKAFSELEEYCYYVASVVGLMMSRIFGLNSVEGVAHAVEMGIAMQLTNILRDVSEDLEKGRIYLPLDELAAAGMDEAFLCRGEVTPVWREFMRGQIARARAYYSEGKKGLVMLENDGSRRTVALMARIYSEILREIEKADYKVFAGRVYVPKWKKMLLALTTRLNG